MTRQEDTELVPAERIASSIRILRGHKVLLDSDLAALYGVDTRRLNEQVRRNRTLLCRLYFRTENRGVRQLEVAICDFKLGRPT